MKDEMCECGHKKGWHVPFDKPALNISSVCGGKTCNCANYRPTPGEAELATSIKKVVRRNVIKYPKGE